MNQRNTSAWWSATRLLLMLGAILLAAAAAHSEDSSAKTSDGQALFEQHCSSCHGMQGHGDGIVSDQVLLRPRDFALDAFKFDTDADWVRGTDADLANVIRNSPSVYGGSPLMPPWAHLSNDDIEALVAYIRQLQG